MVLRLKLESCLLAACVLATGCAAQNAKTASSPTATEPLTFRSPSEIRPADSTLNVPAMPAPVYATPAPTRTVTGEWAPPVKSRDWKYIVIHHSASPSGNAALFDKEHRDKGWDELGYHFVIDNGRGGPDGNIEIGPRWQKQKWGAHAKTPDNRFNDFGIGICLVGNFENGKPTARQMASVEKLTAWLMRTYDIPAKNVMGHEDTGRQTLCPGKFMNVATVRTVAVRTLAEAGFPVADANARVAMNEADRELLKAR